MAAHMKPCSVARIAFGACLFGAVGVALACPDGYYRERLTGICLPNSRTVVRPIEKPIIAVTNDPTKLIVNPGSFIDPTGLPQPGDFMEYVVKNPDKAIELLQNPGGIVYLPVAESMISGRNAVVARSANRAPPHIKKFLLKWYSEELIDSVRWTSDWNIIANTLQTMQMFGSRDTQAIALLNAIVFRSDQEANDPALWAHEMEHVYQYATWGVFTFAKRWVDNSSNNGPVEKPAYARQSEASELLRRTGGYLEASSTDMGAGATVSISTTCAYNHGPKAGQTEYFPPNLPGLTPATVGGPCHDGRGSSGVAVTDRPGATPTASLSTTCQFYFGPRSGQTQYWPPGTPGLTPAQVGSPCNDGLGSSGYAIPNAQ